jgi:hypothetical protein
VVEALGGRLAEHQRQLLQIHLDQIRSTPSTAREKILPLLARWVRPIFDSTP